jgi:hypothetical protein
MALHYITVQDLLNYGQVSACAAGSSGTDAAVANYDLLSTACGWAEQVFEELNGHTSFYAGSPADEIPRQGWVDRHGWVELHAAEFAPVTGVSKVEYIIPGQVDKWTVLGWDSANGIILPPQGAPPNPRAWVVRLNVGYVLARMATGDVEFRWSYTGGYNATPAALKLLLLRVAWWKYKLREAPLGKIASPPFGITEVIPGLPKDIEVDLGIWQYRLA